jgi:plasmid maintenance system antidote protein VapI
MSWQQNRSMTAAELVAVMAKLKLSQAATGRLVGLSQRQIGRMVHGKTQVPTAIALLLNAILQDGGPILVPPRIGKKLLTPY